MSFSIANTSESAVITSVTTPSSRTGELTITSGSFPLFAGDIVGGTNTTIDNGGGFPGGTIQLFIQQGDAKIDTYFNGTLYSSDKYSSGIAPILTPIVQSGDSLTMELSDIDATCFDITSGFTGSDPIFYYAETLKVQPDGKILAGGYFTGYNGTQATRIVRLNTDMTIDTTFDTGSGFNGDVYGIALQSDGKIIVGGAFSQYNGVSRGKIARLNSDGTNDSSFVIGTGFSSNVWGVTVQSDGKIICTGDFSSFSGQSRSRITRLNSNGSLDTSFGAISGTNATVYMSALQSNGNIIVVGDFSTISGVSRNGIARLTSTGQVDTSFVIGTGLDNSAYGVAIDSDDKILVTGYFSTYSGASRPSITRLNSGGTLDTSFVVGSGFTQTGTGSGAFGLDVYTQGDKVIVSGCFNAYDGDPVDVIARLNSDGSLDTSFNQGSGFVYDPASYGNPSVILNNGQYLVNGAFSSYDGNSVPNFAVLSPFGKLLNCV